MVYGIWCWVYGIWCLLYGMRGQCAEYNIQDMVDDAFPAACTFKPSLHIQAPNASSVVTSSGNSIALVQLFINTKYQTPYTSS